MDQMTVSNRAKSACEILEIATLVTHFTFDTASLLTDSGPNSLQATTQSTSSSSSGRYSQAITFNGSTSYYRISTFIALGRRNQPFSISLWLQPTSLLGIVVYVSSVDGNRWCMPFLGFAGNGALQAQIFKENSVVSVTDPTHSVTTSDWSFVVQTWSPTNGLRLYINQVLVALHPYPIYDASSSPNYITLGNALSGAEHCRTGGVNTSPYQGDMDDFRVYSRELTADDVYTLYIN
jgi:hypothetical protein